jgi:hypothetical protein
MDGSRFDDLTRTLAATLSRRSLLRVLGGSLAGALFTSLTPARPAWGQATPPESIAQQLGNDFGRIHSAASRDKNWQQLHQFAITQLGGRPRPSTAWTFFSAT